MRERSHPGTPGKQALHSRGGKTSKSSSINSFDVGGGGYTQNLPSQRWGHEVGGRSSSFDHGQRPPLTRRVPGRPIPPIFSWLTITKQPRILRFLVPSRPAGAVFPSASPSVPPSEYEPKTPDRKRDTRSRSGPNKTAQSKYATTGAIVPPLPPLDVDSAPAPHVGYGKSKEAQQAGQVLLASERKAGLFQQIIWVFSIESQLRRRTLCPASFLGGS